MISVESMGSSLAAVAETAMSLIKMSMFKVANDENVVSRGMLLKCSNSE